MAINILLNMVVSRGETAPAQARRQAILLRSCAALRLLVSAVGDQDFIEHGNLSWSASWALSGCE
ncbi:hypothetical protein [Chromobacterium paludis]|uniref:hypothetical protein n=1 Tax=Chromobacterium paludis TaxID=2605945 RepID=UPI00143CC92B|nr:hypothetical protein [Chromobacterium paludis]